MIHSDQYNNTNEKESAFADSKEKDTSQAQEGNSEEESWTGLLFVAWAFLFLLLSGFY